jgi:hypothetical protein
MSVHHWWVGILLDEAEYARVQARFQEAAQQAVADAAAQSVLATWKSRPSDFDHGGVEEPVAGGEQVNSFISAFNLPAFREFGLRFVKPQGQFWDFVAEDRFFRFVSVRKCTPVSVVWQVLGPERALRLPGDMGNLLLRPAEVPATLENVENAYGGTTSRGLFERAMRYCGASGMIEKSLEEAITFLPDGLLQARDAGKGFLSFGLMEC